MTINNKLLFTACYKKGFGKALYKVEMPSDVNTQYQSSSAGLKVYPNPTMGSVKLSYPKDSYTSVRAIDATGRVVYSHKLDPNGGQILNLSQLSPATYFLQVSGHAPALSATVILRQ